MLELPAPIVIVNRGSASKLKVLNCLPALNATVVQKQATLLTTDPMATFIAFMGPSVAKRALALALAIVDTSMKTVVALLAIRRTP